MDIHRRSADVGDGWTQQYLTKSACKLSWRRIEIERDRERERQRGQIMDGCGPWSACGLRVRGLGACEPDLWPPLWRWRIAFARVPNQSQGGSKLRVSKPRASHRLPQPGREYLRPDPVDHRVSDKRPNDPWLFVLFHVVLRCLRHGFAKEIPIAVFLVCIRYIG